MVVESIKNKKNSTDMKTYVKPELKVRSSRINTYIICASKSSQQPTYDNNQTEEESDVTIWDQPMH